MEEEDKIEERSLDVSLAYAPTEMIWAKSPNSAMEEVSGTWRLIESASIVRPDIFVKSSDPYTQKSSIYSQSEIPRLESLELFQSSSSATPKIEWLYISSLPCVPSSIPALNSEFNENPINSVPSTALESPRTWMPKPSIIQMEEPYMFSTSSNQPLIRKHRQEPEKEIESTELWKKDKDFHDSTKHWLLG